MSAPPYMKLYWGDYHKGTRHLRTAREHGAYMLLIGALWDAGGRLPPDDATMARHALCTAKEWAALRETILPLFRIIRGHLTHKRVTEELAKYGDTVRKRKIAGKSGAAVTNEKRSRISAANAEQKPTKSETESEEEKKPPLAPQGGRAPLFEEDPPAEPKRRKSQRPIPEGYPDADAIEAQRFKAAAARADLDIAYQAERFRNWALGKDARYADWPATWANWCAKAIREAPKAAARTSAPIDLAATWRHRVEAYLRGSRYWNTNDWGAAPGKEGCHAPPAVLAEFGLGGAAILPFPVEGRAA